MKYSIKIKLTVLLWSHNIQAEQYFGLTKATAYIKMMKTRIILHPQESEFKRKNAGRNACETSWEVISIGNLMKTS